MTGSVNSGGQNKAFKNSLDGMNMDLYEKGRKNSRRQKNYSILCVLILSPL